MASRLQLHEELCELLGSRNVYYQPPASLLMEYPCIRYSKVGIVQRRADGMRYISTNRYELVVIDYDVDSDIPDNILDHFQMASFDRQYASDGLNHFVITLYY